MLVRPRNTFISEAVSVAGTVLTPSDVLDDSHPHVRAHPDWFEPIRATIPMPDELVEQTTAAPGEKRTARART